MHPSVKPRNSTAINPTVRSLGWVSFFTDLSSEMVYPITPIFLTTILGAPVWIVGLIEGIAESTASLLKLYSGWLSDQVGQRKPFAIAGYGLAALSKPLIGVAVVWGQVLVARFLDRVGKGLRAAPRDALIADHCPANQRGRAFGFHRSMDTLGSLLGPLVGFGFLLLFPGQFRGLYLLAFAPALVSVLVLLLRVQEPRKDRLERGAWRSLPQFSLHNLSSSYRNYLLITLLFGLGNSSDAFLLLRAQDVGFDGSQVLLLYAVFNLIEAMLARIVGQFSDRVGRRPLLIAGYLVFSLVYLGFALVQTPGLIWLLFLGYGMYETLIHGVQKALVVDLVHPERRGAEIGTFYMLSGFVALPASLLAGFLYTRVAVAAPFLLSAALAALAALILSTVHLSTQDPSA
ncbi:MAG: MFS transporter [Synechococcales cyanobacterium RU_4_20]|nr:MFS transporter [Synechococcales cyanobacterium RU_4_20]